MKAFIRISKKNATQQDKEQLIKLLHEAGFKDSDFILVEKEATRKRLFPIPIE